VPTTVRSKQGRDDRRCDRQPVRVRHCGTEKGAPAIIPQLDPVTAESMLADTDFATEHKRPTFADEPCTEGPDESVPTGHGGSGRSWWRW
jgi:hypothetical protein